MLAQPSQASGSMLPPVVPGFGGFATPGPIPPLQFILNNLHTQQHQQQPTATTNGQMARAPWPNTLLQQQQSTTDTNDFSESDEYDNVLVTGLGAARTYGISYLTAINCIPNVRLLLINMAHIF